MRKWLAAFVIGVALLCAGGVAATALVLHPPRRAAIAPRNVALTAADDVVLRGVLLWPERANGDAVIVLHGVGDSADGVLPIAQALQERGFLVLAPDSRAHGESGGSVATYGLRERDDLARWAEWLEAADGIRCTHALGISMGAAIAIQAFAATAHVCTIAVEAPFTTFEAVALDRVGFVFHTGRWLGVATYPAYMAGSLYARTIEDVDLSRVSPLQVVEHSRVPILYVHSERDRKIPPRHSDELMARTRSVHRLWRVQDGLHAAAFAADPDAYIDTISRWFHPLQDRE